MDATSHPPPWGLVLLLAVVGGAAMILALAAVTRNRARQAHARDRVRCVLAGEADALSADISQRDGAAAATAAARAEVDRARTLIDSMRSTASAAAVSRALHRSRTLLAGAPDSGEPATGSVQRPACLIDPRHGPSTRSTMYAPTGARRRRQVPVCDGCGVALDAGAAVQPRTVERFDGRVVPYWQAGEDYGPYAYGYLAGVGAALPVVLFGTMISGELVADQLAATGTPVWPVGDDVGQAAVDALGADVMHVQAIGDPGAS